MWERKLVCNTEEEADPHIALTKTCLYAVARWTVDTDRALHKCHDPSPYFSSARERRGARVTCWDFWSYNQSHNWDSSTFLEDLDPGALF